MTNAAIIALRVLLILIALGLLLGQVWVIPSLAGGMAFGNPEYAYLQMPFTIVAVLIVACAEVVLVCIWYLLSRVRAGAIFGASAFPAVNVVIGSLIVAALLDGAIFVYLVFILRQINPGFGLILLAGFFGPLALALLMYVMRSLLKRATDLEHDLSEVV